MKKIDRRKIQSVLNVSHATVSQWLNGITKPTADKMFTLEDEFKIPLSAWRDIKAYLQKDDMQQKKLEDESKKGGS